MFTLTLMLLPEEGRDRIRRLWEESGDMLIRSTIRLLGSAATYKDAEDIVGEAFLRLIEHFERYEGRTDEQMKAILLRTCENLSINEYRRGQKIAFTVYDEEEEESVTEAAPAPEDLLLSDECIGRLKAIIRSLDAKYREVLEMKILEELPDDVIAAELGIPRGTVRTRLMRARRLVIEEWKKGED